MKKLNQQNEMEEKQKLVLSKKGCESVLTVNLLLDVDIAVLEEKFTEHAFYIPNKKGLSTRAFLKLKQSLLEGDHYTDDKEGILKWLKAFLSLTTDDISCPAMRDKTLAPPHQSGLIISTLFEYNIVKHVKAIGLYDCFNVFVEKEIADIFLKGILKGLKTKVIDVFSSTPLTIETYTRNSDGAITGWSSTNKPIPAVSKLSKIASSIKTPMADIYQCGHWTFSPEGYLLPF